MKRHRLILILGTDSGSSMPILEAGKALTEMGEVLRRTAIMGSDSVLPGDDRHYLNQALLLATDISRTRMLIELKQLEERLGRRRDSSDCRIDVDLVGECNAADEVTWRDQEKLAHPLFDALFEQVLPALK